MLLSCFELDALAMRNLAARCSSSVGPGCFSVGAITSPAFQP